MERRREPRYLCLGQVKLIRLPGIVWTGRVLDLSLGGCLIEIRSLVYVSRGSVVELTVQSKGTALRMLGKVTFGGQLASGRIGISFTGLSRGGQRRLTELIAELEASVG
ncbi:MAG TPA: PilZ domain-containing protein [Edaphobacter sp.]|nr:PilZ domain-containing protein [Edaphobacter sp.]